MNTVHPAFAHVLDTICPPKKDGKRPKCPRGLYEYNHYTDLGDLVCWVDYTPEERQTYWEPGGPASADLTDAWLGDINVFDSLSDDVIKEIEEAALIEITDTSEDDYRTDE